jgi:uncharacterized protein YndB with AHSA1/START domain
MVATTRADVQEREREIVITRVFDAPRHLVFQAWTEPDRVARWFGPPGFAIIYCKMEVRPGGAFRLCLRSPSGAEYWRQGVYREVVAPERLVYTFVWSDAAGKPHYETLVTVTFAERGHKTELTLHQSTFKSVAAREEHQGDWSKEFQRLAEYLANN